jgi:hypothetical protein
MAAWTAKATSHNRSSGACPQLHIAYRSLSSLFRIASHGQKLCRVQAAAQVLPTMGSGEQGGIPPAPVVSRPPTQSNEEWLCGRSREFSMPYQSSRAGKLIRDRLHCSIVLKLGNVSSDCHTRKSDVPLQS